MRPNPEKELQKHGWESSSRAHLRARMAKNAAWKMQQDCARLIVGWIFLVLFYTPLEPILAGSSALSFFILQRTCRRAIEDFRAPGPVRS